MSWQPNQLVRHTVLTRSGIGVVIREMKRGVKVKFGIDDVGDVAGWQLRLVPLPPDVRKVLLSEVQRWTDISKVPEEYRTLIFGNEIREWVGTAWVTMDVIQEGDLSLFPVVVDKL